ncbi:MAG: type II secretion system F family protein [Bacillota bacterium]|nr:type II secretion system F family protein [Bacillota bacterium]
MRILLYIITFTTATLISLIFYDLIIGRKKQVKGRLDNIKEMTPIFDDEEDLKKPITDRLIKPAYESFLRFIGSVAPKQIREKYEDIINNAGSPKDVTFQRIIAIQIMVGLLTGGILFLISSRNGKTHLILIILAAVVGFILPVSYFKTQADKRKKIITRQLPDLLDLLYVSVEAGLGFDMALKKTSDKMQGALSLEIGKTLDEINKGKNRQDALRSMVKRTGAEDLSSFITAVIQSEQLGSNITNTLRIQSVSIRQRRRQRAEEAAAKIPVKMLFPLIFFIFPSLLIVVLGPAVINIIKNLGNLF